MSKRMMAVAAACLAVVAVGSVAWAAIPDGNGLIHACYKVKNAGKPGGAPLSVVDPSLGGQCKTGQQEVTFPQRSGAPVAGFVEADGTVSVARGGLAVTLLDPGLFLLEYPAWDAGQSQIVTATPVGGYAAKESTVEVIPSDDQDLLDVLGADSALPGVVIRSLREDGSAAPFSVQIIPGS